MHCGLSSHRTCIGRKMHGKGNGIFQVYLPSPSHPNSYLVLYCTLLAMAETVKERKALESTMKADEELSEILTQLSEYEHEDLVQVKCL